MSVDDPSFVAWEEHIVCHDRGSRVVHYYLKEADGNSIRAVLGTERSIRHMIYVVADEFVKAYESKGFVNPSTKWRARREVVEWLTSMTTKNNPDSLTDGLSQGVGSVEVSEQMIRKLKARNLGISWSGVTWICGKQLKHYASFCRNETTIYVHSFVFIMAEEECNYLGYLEDMYEDRKGMKKVKVRWFHQNEEVKHVTSQLNPHPREVFITPHVQVISAECVDGLAIVLTPKHFEKCLDTVPDSLRPPILMCSRQFKNNRIETFMLTKLRGYHSQAIFSSFDGLLDPKKKVRCRTEGEDLALDDPARLPTKRKRTCKGQQQEDIESSIRILGCTIGNQTDNGESKLPKLKFRFSKKDLGIKFAEPQAPNPVSLKVGDKVEFVSQDSGITGCWFRCKILQAIQKRMKVQYDDLQDPEDSGNLEEWIPACRVMAPDKLGMRCTGRLTIRPPPPEDVTNPMFEIGAAVDTWWCDGWWEGVITRVHSTGNSLHVYLPGESKFLTVDKKTVRASRDWFGNRWVDIKPRPDLLFHISVIATPSTKLPVYPATVASGGGSSASLEYKIHTIPELEADEEQQLPCSTNSDQVSPAGELPQVNDETEIKGGNIDGAVKGYADEAGDNDGSNNNGGGDDEIRVVGGNDESAMEKDPESDIGKCDAGAEMTRVMTEVV